MKFVLTAISVTFVVASFLVNNLIKIPAISQNIPETTALTAKSPMPAVAGASTANPEPQNEFYYPNSKIIDQADGKIVMEIAADPEQVTNWYEDLLKNYNMPANSNIKTQTNGQINNKLIASSGPRTVEVNITKYPDSQIVFINVSY